MKRTSENPRGNATGSDRVDISSLPRHAGFSNMHDEFHKRSNDEIAKLPQGPPQQQQPNHASTSNSTSANLPSDLKEQLQQYLTTRILQMRDIGLDLKAFFQASFEELFATIATGGLLDLYMVQARVEEYDKLLLGACLENHARQQEALKAEQARLLAKTLEFRARASNYCQVRGVAANFTFDPNAMPNSNSNLNSAHFNHQQPANMPLKEKEGKDPNRPYNPDSDDSDMDLGNDDDNHHITATSNHNNNNNNNSNIPNNSNNTIPITPTNFTNNAFPNLPSSSSLSGLNEATGAPQRKKQRTSEVVRHVIDESAKVFTEMALLHLEQEKTYSLLLRHNQRVEKELAQRTTELESANKLNAELESKNKQLRAALESANQQLLGLRNGRETVCSNTTGNASANATASTTTRTNSMSNNNNSAKHESKSSNLLGNPASGSIASSQDSLDLDATLAEAIQQRPLGDKKQDSEIDFVLIDL